MRRLLLFLPLAACAQQPPAPLPAAWVGHSEAELVAQLGVPSRVHEAEGRRFLAYDGNGASYPAVWPSFGLGVGSASGGWGSGTAVGTGLGLSFGPFGQAGPCTTTFEVQEARIITATRAGPGCG